MGMKRRKKPTPEEIQKPVHASAKKKELFHIEFLNSVQKKCWETIQENDIVFLLGSAGSGKTFISTAYSVYSFLRKETQKITITRPIVEAGERLGFLPGSFEDKVHPYMLPIYDTLDELVGTEGPQRTALNKSLEVAPLAYLRGRTFKNSVCILDEAQNCTYTQLKLFLTRLGQNSKLIITGDPKQSDLLGKIAVMEIVEKLRGVKGIGVVDLPDSSIVRHPLISAIVERI
jgi:phosphate starvation-inducible PhoH-like protein